MKYLSSYVVKYTKCPGKKCEEQKDGFRVNEGHLLRHNRKVVRVDNRKNAENKLNKKY